MFHFLLPMDFTCKQALGTQYILMANNNGRKFRLYLLMQTPGIASTQQHNTRVLEPPGLVIRREPAETPQSWLNASFHVLNTTSRWRFPRPPERNAPLMKCHTPSGKLIEFRMIWSPHLRTCRRTDAWKCYDKTTKRRAEITRSGRHLMAVRLRLFAH